MEKGNEFYKKQFQARLKDLCAEKGYSQKAVADRLGLPVSTYANWEQGRTEPSIFDLFQLLKVFEIEANDLFAVEE